MNLPDAPVVATQVNTSSSFARAAALARRRNSAVVLSGLTLQGRRHSGTLAPAPRTLSSSRSLPAATFWRTKPSRWAGLSHVSLGVTSFYAPLESCETFAERTGDLYHSLNGGGCHTPRPAAKGLQTRFDDE